jgi:hypothetical protein
MAVKKIILKAEDLCIRKEGIAGAAITPGCLVSALPNGAVALQGAADTAPQKAFVYEREMTGDDIDTAYAQNDTILYAICPPGVEVYAFAGEAVNAGDVLESAANGELQGITTGAAVAVALETVGAAGRCKVEVL